MRRKHRKMPGLQLERQNSEQFLCSQAKMALIELDEEKNESQELINESNELTRWGNQRNLVLERPAQQKNTTLKIYAQSLKRPIYQQRCRPFQSLFLRHEVKKYSIPEYIQAVKPPSIKFKSHSTILSQVISRKPELVSVNFKARALKTIDTNHASITQQQYEKIRRYTPQSQGQSNIFRRLYEIK